MATFTADNRDAWNALFQGVDAQCPRRGRRVRVTGGRKYVGLEGTVLWHGEDKYYSAAHHRYMSDAQLALSQARGREGYRIKVALPEVENVFLKANYVEVVVAD